MEFSIFNKQYSKPLKTLHQISEKTKQNNIRLREMYVVQF